MKFEDPFSWTPNDSERCDDKVCTSTPTPNVDYICGYDVSQTASCTGCLDGNCFGCESIFNQLSVEFLGAYVAGFSSRLGFGPSESVVNIDLVLKKYSCPEVTNPINVSGVCCLPDGSCSQLYADEIDCENAGGTWYSGVTCDDDPCGCASNCLDGKYVGAIGYIYNFDFGQFCFRGILSNHTYSEDNNGYRYRVTLTDGRSLLNNLTVILNGIYSRIPNDLNNNVINLLYNAEPSIGDNTCGNGQFCKDFMKSGANFRGVQIKKALQALNGSCISVPISGAGLKLNIDKVINIVSDELRTTNTESSAIDLISLACEESGYDFIATINNNNEIEIIPVNYKIVPPDYALLQFITDMSADDIVISKEYGEETTNNKNKRLVFGDNVHYITSAYDFPAQRFYNPVQALLDLGSAPLGSNPLNILYPVCTIYNSAAEQHDNNPIKVPTVTPPPGC